MTNTPPAALADYVRARMEARGWSLRTLAMYAEVSPGSVSALLRGLVTPRAETLKAIAGALEVDEARLLRLAGHIETPPTEQLDGEALYIAQRLTALPPGVRERAVDAVAAVLDTVYALYQPEGERLGPRLVDTPEPYTTEEVVQELVGDFEELDEEAELVRLLTIAAHHDPEGVRAIAERRAARRAAAGNPDS